MLVDRVVELEPQVYAVGYKNVTANDNFFTGHFPDRKIMPGKRESGEKEREREGEQRRGQQQQHRKHPAASL